MVARALTPEDIDEMERHGLGSMVRFVDQVAYSDEDLVHCDDCDFVAVTNDPMDHMNRCPDCARQAAESAADLEDLRSWYRRVAR